MSVRIQDLYFNVIFLLQIVERRGEGEEENFNAVFIYLTFNGFICKQTHGK